ncbi:MAG: hypothetical protein K2H64_09765 [Desulfovibrio sp.]|nr:hypothetical protein [Desulfovibrio sp.]
MKFILTPLLFFACLAAPALGADEKIDPKTYICAELIASAVDGVPPIYEGLQLDGFIAGQKGAPVADPELLQPLLLAVFDSCSAEPADKAAEHWAKSRESWPIDPDGAWRADKTTCADYAKNPDDGSGFVIWLDAYNRAAKNTDKSVLADQETLEAFLDKCSKNPGKLMIDVMAESGK